MIKTFNFKYIGTIQTWMIPYDGIYKIEAYGAQGGNVGKVRPNLHEGGKGAYISGKFNLKAGNNLYILVGGACVSKDWYDWVGGGGAGDDGCNIVGNGQTLPGYGGVGRAVTTTEGSGRGSSSGSGAGSVTNGNCSRMSPALSFINISLLYGTYTLFFQKDNEYYLPIGKYFNTTKKSFDPISLNDLMNEIYNNNYLITNLYDLNTPFVINSITYNPLDYLDISKCRMCLIQDYSDVKENISTLNIKYSPSSIALAKTNIKIRDKYDKQETAFINITPNSKSDLSYFLDYGENKLYKECSELGKEIIKDDFYANFMFDTPNALLSSVTLYGKNNDKYSKIKNYEIEVYENLNEAKFITFKNSYNEVLVNKITKESFDYTINTLDKF
ncbi:hypothetical protein B0P06_006112 [Clostridium saccharoperbutylacetonicum]|uniref:Glycine rich protein n=1 Tax=Clostridium saccharoperbutylacetonicum N1-4(HMT) TaxID=931276 RepID=M1MP32_9CLOT|nr:glycine rich domain-containing protein [Clostridium saccharoperbutylacetonicum]AGF59614.1 glycine rich protein [Clostridium saccharoperbutylacetonicum N1-4(HMT)]NRT64529.1 hypothetical protein [Clostridium saccharoperbutylacetonicum]NSB29004.1 hypothetical protein [Clostridium saccharoperbutylacetonicum]NSB46219.1 hypothetical protein [Clostridium saccharoperbutylacetonicum]